MENENKIPAQIEEKKKNKKRFKIGEALVWLGSTALIMWWVNHYFALKNHTHDMMAAATRRGASSILVIDDDNMGEYIKEVSVIGDDGKTYYLGDRFGFILKIPNEYDSVVIDTSNRYRFSNIMPTEGEFEDGKRLIIVGAFQLKPSEKFVKDGENVMPDEYTLSSHIYTDQANNNGGYPEFYGTDKNGCELLCFRKEWYFIV